ncbi:MAG: hypothetical protein AAB524_01840 [Patescibacteria group bacterium]
MNLEEIKEIIKKEGGKIVIVENDKPQMVIMSFDEWRGKMRQGQTVHQSNHEASKPMPLPSEERAEGLTIDDLPL